MKTLYLDLQNGIAGDMLCAALLDLFENPQDVLHELQHLGLPVSLSLPDTARCGIQGRRFVVKIHGEEENEHNHEHSHAHKHDSHTHSHYHHREEAHIHLHDCSDHTEHDDFTHERHEHAHTHEHKHTHEHAHTHAHVHAHAHEHSHEHTHSHSDMHEIGHIIDRLSLSDRVKADSIAVYRLIADAESLVHGVPVEQIHFHEVGELDAVADIVCACYLLDKLGVERVLASPINTGSGTVQCAHGILPVPAPATLNILKGIPIYAARAQSELCTPTGAALAKHFVQEFCDMPVSVPERIGYGMGKKEFAFANCVRAILSAQPEDSEEIELTCNIDDMSPEHIAFACTRLLEEGASDVYCEALHMKKNRLGTKLSLLCRSNDREKFLQLLFAHTSSIGVREYSIKRHKLHRRSEIIHSSYGPIHCKRSEGYGVARCKPEHEDIAQIARENNTNLHAILRDLSKENTLL